MNISNIDLAPPEIKALSPKTDTEGTDLFSIFMASIAAGNGIQQGSYNATADGDAATFTGQVIFSTVDVTVTGQDAGSDPAVTDAFAGIGKPATEVSAMPVPAFKNTIGVGSGDAGDNDAALELLKGKVSDSNSSKTGADGIMGELTNRSQSIDSLNPLVAGEIAKGLSHVVPYQTLEKTVNGEKRMELQLLGVAGPVEEAPEGDSVRLLSQLKKAEPIDPPNAQPLLPQAVKGVKEGDGIEAEESNVKAGTIISGNDEGETVKGLDIGGGIVSALGRESVDPRLFHASAKPLVAVGGQRPQIDPVDLVAQVSGKIKADFNSEGGEVQMELHPESLGHLKIEIKVEGGVIRANILTENAMVKDTIDSNLSVLKTSLEEHGLRIDQISVGVGHQHGGNAFAERRDIQIWQGFENADSSLYEGEEPVNESWYSVDSRQEQGVNIFA